MAKKKNNKKKNGNVMKRAPVNDDPPAGLGSEAAVAQGWQNPPLTYMCEEDKVPEPVLVEADEPQEPSASKDWEKSSLPYEEEKAPEAVLDEANKAQEPVTANKSILRDAPVSEYRQPEIR
jgi:hypothetical protein